VSLHASDVVAARALIAPHVAHTPSVRSPWLSRESGHEVWLKLESLQPTHSFKVRGATCAVVRRAGLAPQGFVTASAGNHGAALAYAAHAAGVGVTVYAPAQAPQTKLARIRGLGATLVAEYRNYDEAEGAALAHAERTGADYVSPYNDRDVICGQGTIALEAIEDVPGCDAIVVPVGGGGLASGIALAASGLDRPLEVFGVEPELNPAFTDALRAGQITTIPVFDTIADGLGGNIQTGSITFGLIRDHGVRMSLVSEAAMARAIGDLVQYEHLVIEGAAAAAIAGVASGAVTGTGRTVVVVVTGANIDRARLRRLLE
jgi:threonine dehydratase